MESEKIDIFEHLIDPLDEMKLETMLRLWQAMPYFETVLSYRMIDLLKEKGYWKQVLKHDMNKAVKCLSPAANRLMEQCIHLEEEGSSPMNFETSLCEKFIDSFIKYYQKVIEMASISAAPTEDEKNALFKKYMVDRAQFLITLHKGDVFTFIDGGKYEEFTYDGFRTVRNEVICDYISVNSHNGPKLFHCENIYRPVIKQNVE